MSTHSKIHFRNRSIYVHFDGMPTGLGKILLMHYDKTKRIQKVLDLGNLSFLTKRLRPIKNKNPFKDRKDDVTVAYCRDVDEDFMTGERYRTQYNYFYKKGQWFVDVSDGNGLKCLKQTIINNLDDKLESESDIEMVGFLKKEKKIIQNLK